MDMSKIHRLRPTNDLAEVKLSRRATPITPYDDGATFTQDDTHDGTWVSDLATALKESEKPDGGDSHEHAGAAPIMSGLVAPGPKAHEHPTSDGGFDLGQLETQKHAAGLPLVQPEPPVDGTSAAPAPAFAPEANETPGSPPPHAAALNTVGLFESGVQQDPGQADGPAIPLGPGDFDIVPPPPHASHRR